MVALRSDRRGGEERGVDLGFTWPRSAPMSVCASELGTLGAWVLGLSGLGLVKVGLTLCSPCGGEFVH
jgi:hypothetical protein